MATIELHGATIALDWDCAETGPSDPDVPGDGCWVFRYADLVRAIPEGFQHRYQSGRGAQSSQLWSDIGEAPELEEWDRDDPDEDEPEIVSVSNADTAILVLACYGAHGAQGGEFRVSYSGDSAYWAFHDMNHARHDAEVDADAGTVELSVEHGETEDAAHVNGGLEALQNGVGFANIVREISQAGKAFQERFDYQSNALTELCSRVKVSVIP